ncbi:MAG: DUF4105 domain-containing protein [Verrucomicrobiaceae bacterium]|nr:DUF4105 domain-containing protein [Verrucomicrobiaceae bacterium]
MNTLATSDYQPVPPRVSTIGRIGLCFIGLPILLWEMGAVWFDAPLGKGNLVIIALLLTIHGIFVWKIGSLLGLSAAWAGIFCSILALWLTQRPRSDRDWQTDVSKTAWAEVNGSMVTLHHVRNFDYRTPNDFTERWETRTVDLDKITGFDIAICYWGSPWMAHPILSFQFSGSSPICFSIETRKEVGESYSALGGLYRQFELIYIVADERDVIRLRTSVRKGEDVFLYHTNATAVQARERFMEYIQGLNELHASPAWYNAITTNCTTTIRTQRPKDKRMSWDWRFLLNGKADEALYERGVFDFKGLDFETLRKRSQINEKAKAATHVDMFSEVIRR